MRVWNKEREKLFFLQVTVVLHMETHESVFEVPKMRVIFIDFVYFRHSLLSLPIENKIKKWGTSRPIVIFINTEADKEKEIPFNNEKGSCDSGFVFV